MPNFLVISLNPTTNKRTRTRIYLKTRERERGRKRNIVTDVFLFLFLQGINKKINIEIHQHTSFAPSLFLVPFFINTFSIHFCFKSSLKTMVYKIPLGENCKTTAQTSLTALARYYQQKHV